MNMRLAALLTALLSLPVTAQQPDECRIRWGLHVDLFIGAGWAAMPFDELTERPVWSTGSNGLPERDTTQSFYTVRPSHRNKIAPATGGVVGIWRSAPAECARTVGIDDGFGIGFGGLLVLLPDANGNQQTAPAVTLHLGKQSWPQAYVGLVWAPNDAIELPGGSESAHLPPGLTREQFIVRAGGQRAVLLFGVVLGNTSVTGS